MPYIVRYDNDRVIFVKKNHRRDFYDYGCKSDFFSHSFLYLTYILTQGNSEYEDIRGYTRI